MDMMPPQAPAAVTQPAHQDAVATVSRLSQAHAWMSALDASLPAATSAATDEAYLASLTAFWQAPVVISPGAEPIPRWTAFGVRMANVMADEASLRQHDGTLSEAAARVARAFAGSVGGPLPHDIHARELDFGYIAYAGAVVVTDDREPGLALLFTPARGWDEFADLDALHAFVETMVREESASPDALPGILREQLDEVSHARFVSSNEIQGPVFSSLVSRITEVQAEQVARAWGYADATAPDHVNTPIDVAAVTHAAQLHAHLDVAAIMQARSARLVARLNQERLARAPADVRRHWHDAKAAYSRDLLRAEDVRSQVALKNPTSLHDHAAARLREKLIALGIHDDPRDISIQVYPMPALGTPGAVLDALTNGIEPPEGGMLEHIGLLDLALRNVGMLDRLTFRALDKDGNRLAPTLSHARIKALVRDADVGGTYRTLLQRELNTSDEGELRREMAMMLHEARMRFEAADARVGAFQSPREPHFAEDHSERGFKWVQAALDKPTPAGRAKVEGHDVVVSQLTYKNEAVSDVLVFSARSAGSVSRVVLYTPDAPDGRSFREFDTRADAARGFLHAPEFEAYLLDRLPVDFAVVAPNGSGRHFRLSPGEQLANWVFASGDRPRTVEGFGEQAIEGNFHEVTYLNGVSLLSRNLGPLARSTQHADVDNISPAVDADAIARNISWLIGRPFEASWQAYDKIRAGAHGDAFVDLTHAYLASLDFVGAGSLKPLLTRSIAVRSASGSTRLVAAGRPLRDTYGLFDERFVARGVSLRDADLVSDGVYRIRGGRYIEKDGRLYGVRRDGDAWRLSHPESATYAPFVMRKTDGSWTHLGLRGGLRPAGGPLPDLAAAAGQRGRLTFHQQEVARQYLLRTIGEERTLALALALRHGRAALDEPQLAALNTALLHARAAPRNAPFVARARLPVPAAPAPAAPPPAHQGVPAAPLMPGLHPGYRNLHGELLNALTRSNMPEWQQRIFVEELVARAGGVDEASAIAARVAARGPHGEVQMTAAQEAAWSNAMGFAHRANAGIPMMLPNARPLPPVASTQQRLDLAAWPDQVWRNVTAVPRQLRLVTPREHFHATQSRDWTGLHGFPTIAAAPPGADGSGLAPAGWMRIDLRALRERMLRSDDPAAVTLTRVVDDHGERYLLGARNPDARGVELLLGEFHVGPLEDVVDNAVAGPSWAFHPPH